MNIDKNEIIETLKDAGYNITNQRKVIIDVLMDNFAYVLSVESISKKVKKVEGLANLTTVYRNLEVFENLGIVHKIMFEDNMSYYKICFSDHHHHHLICNRCHKIQDMHYCPEKELKEIAKSFDFEIKDHKIEIFGICKNCGDES